MTTKMSNKNKKSNNIFNNFSEYWYFVKYLTHSQRQRLLQSLTIQERNKLNRSFEKGGWKSVFMRDSVNNIVDEAKEKYGYDLIYIRAQVKFGKSVYVPREFWDYVENQLSEYSLEDKSFAIGGIWGKICESNEDVVAVLPVGRDE